MFPCARGLFDLVYVPARPRGTLRPHTDGEAWFSLISFLRGQSGQIVDIRSSQGFGLRGGVDGTKPLAK